VDPFFPAPEQSVDGKEIEALYGGEIKADKNMGKIEEDAEVY
jgi:hypothetical protein